MKNVFPHVVFSGNLNNPCLVCHFSQINVGYDQVGVLYGRAGDVVVTVEPIDPAYLNYLHQLGWETDKMTFIAVGEQPDYTLKSLLNHRSVKAAIKGKKLQYLNTYFQDIAAAEMANSLKLPFYGNVNVAQNYVTKSQFRKLAKKLKLPIVEGFEDLYTPKEITAAVLKIFKLGYSQALIKLNEGTGGYGQLVIHHQDFSKMTATERHQLVTDFFAEHPILRPEQGAVVERFVPDVIASVGAYGELHPDLSYKYLFMHELLIDGDTVGIGHVYPPPHVKKKIKERLINDVEQFCRFLQKQKYVGQWAFDVIISKSGQYFFPEVTMRKMGGSLPQLVRQKLFPDQKVTFISRSTGSKKLINSSYSFLHFLLQETLLNQNNKKGVVIFNISKLLHDGKFSYVCFAPTLKEAEKYVTDVEQKISQISWKDFLTFLLQHPLSLVRKWS